MEYEIIVIGSGGGTKLVSPVAKLGHRVLIIEREKLGGTCLNRGCIPSKMLIHPADLIADLERIKRYHMDIDGLTIDFPSLIDEVNRTVDRDSDSIAPMYEKNPNIDYVHGHARFVSDNEVEVDGKVYCGKKVLIAVGADAHVPDIPGLADTPYITYRQALRSKKQPERMIIVGGGYIAVELGHFFGSLGTEVEFVVRSSMLKGVDGAVREEFEQVFSERFSVHKGLFPKSVSHQNGEFIVDLGGTELRADSLLMATGVRPMTSDLGLEHTSVTLDSKGFVEVDPYLKTQSDSVWAIGDCTGGHLFRHTANFEGEYLFRHLYGDERAPLDYGPVPYAVFSYPQIGAVGASEEELVERGIEYIAGYSLYPKCGMGMAMRADHGFVKLLFDQESLKLLGAHIVGEEASNMVHMCIAFMKMNAKLHDMLETIYIHPALPELVRNAVRDAKRHVENRALV